MKRHFLPGLLLIGCSLAWVGAALAATSYYASPGSWFQAGSGYSSSYTPGWRATWMATQTSVQGTVVFIDAQSYGWHSTVTSTGTYRSTTWTPNGVSRKAYCLETRAMSNGGTYGSCLVNTSA